MIFWKKPQISGRVSICIPTFKDSHYIIELCLKSIKKYTDYPDYQIIVCDAGVDEETGQFLSDAARKNEIKLIKATDWERPKDDLAAAVDTEYYLLMHDDIRVFRHDWLLRRMQLMNQNEKNAIVGTIVKNYNKSKRFFPLGLLVKTEVSRKLNLKWGKMLGKGMDTGAIAYDKFFSQNEYKFVPYKMSRDICHFSSMTWPTYKDKNHPGIEKLLNERERKVRYIRWLLDNNRF